MDKKSSRREFIKNLYYAIWGGLASSLVLQDKTEAKSPSFRLHDWAGDDFDLGGHDLRDHKIPKFPKNASRTVDVVILGGGMAGLAAANYLNEREFLLLEMYENLGGHSRGSSYRGIDFTYGAAYFADDEGHLSELVDSLGLKPIKLTENKDSWLWNGQFVCEEKDKKHIFFKELNRIKKDVSKVSNLAGPRLIDAYKKNPELRALDQIKMNSFLKGYDEQFVSLFDNFFKSSLCGDSNRVSALSGLYLMEDLFNPTYVLPGGNPAIAKALVSKLSKEHKEQLKTRSFVWSVELNEKGASVVYSDSNKQIEKIDCNHVVIALPHMVSARIMSNLDKKTKSMLLDFQYGSYLVANLLLNKRIFQQSYDNWFSPPYEFADISLADTPYLETNSIKRDDASVLTVFQPYQPGSLGRVILQRGDKSGIAMRLVDQISKILPGLSDALEEISLSRWGHALAVPKPGYYNQLVSLQNRQAPNFSLAHSSAQGIPSAEAAVDAARRVVDKLNGKTVSSKQLYSIPRL